MTTHHFPIRRPPPAEPQRTTCDAGRRTPGSLPSVGVRHLSLWLGQRRVTRLVGVPRCALQARPQEPGPARAIFTTTTPLTNADRLRMWVRRSDRQGSGDCSRPSGWELFCRAVRIVAGVALFIAWLMLAVIALWALYGAAATPEPDCRKQWTPDARYVRHCDFGDNRGWVVTP